jgi:hypothetical protein
METDLCSIKDDWDLQMSREQKIFDAVKIFCCFTQLRNYCRGIILEKRCRCVCGLPLRKLQESLMFGRRIYLVSVTRIGGTRIRSRVHAPLSSLERFCPSNSR